MDDPFSKAKWISTPRYSRRGAKNLFRNSKILRWVRSFFGGSKLQSSPMFRHEFIIRKPFKSAKLSICGLGYYEAWINAKRVGDHVLDPAQTDYEKRIFY